MLYNYMPLYSKLHLPPSANPGLSIAEPSCSHAVCTLKLLPPTSPCPTLSAYAESILLGHVHERNPYHYASYVIAWKIPIQS